MTEFLRIRLRPFQLSAVVSG